MILVLPLNVTTPHDSFCLFIWNYRELANSLLTLYVTGLKVVSNPGPFDQDLSDLPATVRNTLLTPNVLLKFQKPLLTILITLNPFSIVSGVPIGMWVVP